MKTASLSALAAFCLLTACSKEKEERNQKKSDIQTVVVKNDDPPVMPKSGTTGENTKGDVKDQYVFINKVYQKDGKWFADTDYVQFLVGDDALQKVISRGLAEKETDENGKEHYFLPNNYAILNDTPTIRTFEIDPSAEIFTYDFKSGKSVIAAETPKTDINALAKTREDEYPYLIDVKNGKISRIKQIFIP